MPHGGNKWLSGVWVWCSGRVRSVRRVRLVVAVIHRCHGEKDTSIPCNPLFTSSTGAYAHTPPARNIALGRRLLQQLSCRNDRLGRVNARQSKRETSDCPADNLDPVDDIRRISASCRCLRRCAGCYSDSCKSYRGWWSDSQFESKSPRVKGIAFREFSVPHRIASRSHVVARGVC